MTVAPFDFRVPTAAAKDRATQEWLEAACRGSGKLWATRWPFAAELKSSRIEPGDPADTLRLLPETALGFAIESDAAPDKAALLTVERPLLLAILAGLLGETPKAIPDDRGLTVVERSLIEFVMPQLLEPFLVTWPSREPPRISVSPPGLPRAMCRLPSGDSALVATLEFHGPFGVKPIMLLIPAGWPAATSEPSVRAMGAFERAEMEAVLREMPLEFSVILGQSRVTLGQLTHLKPGDVLVLGQRVADPLRAQIAGSDRFDVWPGAIGSTQAVQVHAARRAPAS